MYPRMYPGILQDLQTTLCVPTRRLCVGCLRTVSLAYCSGEVHSWYVITLSVHISGDLSNYTAPCYQNRKVKEIDTAVCRDLATKSVGSALVARTAMFLLATPTSCSVGM